MIKGITAGELLQVDNGHPSTAYIPSTSQPMSGMTRYCNNTLEVYDGHSWQQVPSNYAHIKLSAAATSAIQWALSKMAQEQEIKNLAKDHPAVQIALDNVEKARLQLEATIILSKEHEQSTT